jgi:hypothetical protein
VTYIYMYIFFRSQLNFSRFYLKNTKLQCELLLLFDASDLCLKFWLLKLFCKVLERSVSGSFRENLFQFWLSITGFVCFTDFDFFPYWHFQKKICLNKSFCLTMVLYFVIICVHECVKTKKTYLFNFYRTSFEVIN